MRVKLVLLFIVVVLFGSVSLLGSLRPLYPSESYFLVGGSVMVVEVMLALVFARGIVKIDPASASGSDCLRSILAALIIFIPAAMVPTSAILYINQAFDRGPSVEQNLPVTRTYTEYSGRGSKTFFAVVPPPPRWIFSTGTEDDIRLSWNIWRKLVPGRSMLTLTIHPGRFGLLWYDVASTTNRTEPPV